MAKISHENEPLILPERVPPNKQVGGDHYVSPYMHWDWAILCGMSGLEYAATKYLARWEKKGGVQDIEKAVHYLEKLLQSVEDGLAFPPTRHLPEGYIRKETERFLEVNGIAGSAAECMRYCSTWRDPIELKAALGYARELLYLVNGTEKVEKDGV